MKKTIADIMLCHACKGFNVEIYNTDEIDFGYNGTGHYFADCRCYDCQKDFRLKMHFKYEVTDK